MHAEIELQYDFETTVKKLDGAEYARLYTAFPNIDLPPWPPDAKWALPWDKRSHIVELETLGQTLTELGVAFTVKRFKSTYLVADHTHTHIHVAIPNVGLLMVDEVRLLEDACTDRLQELLDDRWRILAVCPPAAQRRPDYILGRTRSPA